MPHRRRTLIKRRVALVAAAITCGTRAYAYGPWVTREQLGVEVATAGGAWLPLFAALWGLAALWCLVCIPSGRLITAIAGLVGMMVMWGVIWGIAWITQVDTFWWQTAITYAGPGVVIGALLVLTPRDSDRGDAA